MRNPLLDIWTLVLTLHTLQTLILIEWLSYRWCVVVFDFYFDYPFLSNQALILKLYNDLILEE